jgi:hypothetical protein
MHYPEHPWLWIGAKLAENLEESKYDSFVIIGLIVSSVIDQSHASSSRKLEVLLPDTTIIPDNLSE